MEISQLVRVRRARWRVVGIRPYDTCRLVTVAAAEAGSLDTIRRFLAPFDVIEPVDGFSRPRRVSAARWRRACRKLIADDVAPGSLRGALDARIELLPHQLEPALAILRGAGTRVLLADAVGLGKTIQAGLVVSELKARGYADSVLVLAPSGLRQQWAQEWRHRFGLDIGVADAPTLRRLAAELPVGVNPWTTLAIAIASVDYVKRPEVLPAVRSCRWDVVVVDEAHGAVGDSDRHDAVRALTAGAAYVLLVTATPHNGDERAFASLCELGRVDGDELIVFRRPRAIMPDSPARRVHILRIRPTGAESRVHALLAQYTDAVRQEHGDRCLALSVLHKRAFSGCWALAESIERRLAGLSPAEANGQQLPLPLWNRDGEGTDEDRPPAWPTDVALADAGRERRLLMMLLDAARTADSSDSKIRALGRLLRRVRESIIVFTEYRDTLKRLRAGMTRPAILLHGGLAGNDREQALHAFVRQPGTVLLATDAAGQGLNLHHHCRIVVSFELPWNPMRLEQRIGRVDRIGQRRRVHAFHFVGAATNEMRVLSRLRARIARAGADLGTPDPFGADEEHAAARLVVLGSHDAETGLNPLRTEGDGPVVLDLRHDAEREAKRLAAARCFAGESSGTDLGDRVPMITRAHRRRVRQQLNGQALVIWRVTATDESGNVAESRVIPALVDPRLPWSDLQTAVQTAARDWQASVWQITSRFWNARLHRERRLAAYARGSPAEIFQPGLFDRRAERARLEQEAVETERASESRSRLAGLEQMSRLDFPSPELVLVLIP